MTLLIKMQTFDYEISHEVIGFELVTGFALDTGLPIKMCVRQLGGLWRLDDFLTGHSLIRISDDFETLIEFIIRGHELLEEKLNNGQYQKALDKYVQDATPLQLKKFKAKQKQA
jgi:hypothetical protein